MKVTSYDFGKIDIDGITYTSDVIITPEAIEASWWRKEGHRLQLDDLTSVLAASPDIVIIGTGFYGRMAVPLETLKALHARGIKTHVSRTGEAIEALNRLQQEAARVIAALHLTC